MPRFIVLFSLIAALIPPLRAQSPATPRLAVDWPAFLGRHDLVWEQLPRQWNEGAFVGNGQLGMMVYATLKDNRIDFHLGRQDVTDHRKAPDRKTSMGVAGASVLWDFPRLDLGRMALRPAGKIKDGTLRQDLWNAEITGTITTDLGELKIRALTLRDRMVQIVQVNSTEKTTDGKPAVWKWEFRPGNPISPRAVVFPDQAKQAKYVTNPNPMLQVQAKAGTCVQPLLAGGDYATAWSEKTAPGARVSTLFISTANEVPAAGKSAPLAIKDVNGAAAASFDTLLADHRKWWHAFYQKSFITIPDARMEAFYWIQLYKFAAASREGGPAVDLFGPWFRTSQWPGIWWNLNIQLTYWPVYAGNHLELGENYLDVVDAHFDQLLAGFINSPTLGDFAWAMHNYWWQLRFAGDWKGVHEKWTPKAKAVLSGYLPRLRKNAGGKLELDAMGSPEYHGFKTYPNTNYNLAILRWLLNSLLEADARSGKPADPAAAEWKRILSELIPYPVDDNGLRIASNQPVDMSHRHFSHLLGLYPLYQLDPNSPTDRELVIKSVIHWHKIGGGKALAGYSYTGGTSLYASLGMGDEAGNMLHNFLTGNIGISQLLPNTFYVESGGRNPVIETPLSGASATLDLLLQSWGGKIRVFPAMPGSWKDSSFHQLRAMDGFLVSAERHDGKTRWVTLRSEAGEPCVLRVADWNGPLEIIGMRQHQATPLAPGEWSIDLKKGEQVLIHPRGGKVQAMVKPLPLADADQNLYGVKKGKHLAQEQVWPELPLPAGK
jgi:hypothetical protein